MLQFLVYSLYSALVSTKDIQNFPFSLLCNYKFSFALCIHETAFDYIILPILCRKPKRTLAEPMELCFNVELKTPNEQKEVVALKQPYASQNSFDVIIQIVMLT